MQQQNTYNQPPMGQMMPPQQAMPMSRRARWGKQLMAGKAIWLRSLPDWFATYAVASYAVALLGVNMVYSSYATEWYFWLFGIVWVAGFFFLSVKFSKEWEERRLRSPKAFEKKLFMTGFAIRALYAVFIYYFYINMTGVPHEFASADSTDYIETAKWFLDRYRMDRLGETLASYSQSALGDIGYPLFIMLPISIIEGDGAILLLQQLNALFGSATAVLVYRIAARSMGESTARLAAIFCMLHPVLICYVGITLKEVVMTFLVVLFIDMGDRMLRSRKYSIATILPLVFVGLSFFLFRVVLGAIAFLALGFAIVMLDSKIVSWGRKILFGAMITGVLLLAASDTIIREVNKLSFDEARNQQETSLTYRYGEKKGGGRGNSFAKYAGVAVFAPLIFTIPFPTIVVVDGQEDMRLIHGGNWMRNVMSGLVILAMFMLLFSGDWRKYTLPLAMMLGYLVMLAFTTFAHSLRFHIPVMPFEMMFAAYAMTNMRKKHRNWYLIWCILCIVMCFGWNWMKLKGRGL